MSDNLMLVKSLLDSKDSSWSNPDFDKITLLHKIITEETNFYFKEGIRNLNSIGLHTFIAELFVKKFRDPLTTNYREDCTIYHNIVLEIFGNMWGDFTEDKYRSLAFSSPSDPLDFCIWAKK